MYDTPTMDDQFHMVLSQRRLRVLQQWGHRRSPAVGLQDYMTVGPRPILLLLATSLPAGLYAAALLLYMLHYFRV